MSKQHINLTCLPSATKSETMSTTQLSETVLEFLEEPQSNTNEKRHKSLQAIATKTKVSPQNRNSLAKTNGAIPALVQASMSSSPDIQKLALSILFNLSLNPNLKRALADMKMILYLNSLILFPNSTEISKLAASLLCSLAMLDKNKAKFGVAGTIEAVVKAISKPKHPATQHLLSTLAELVQFHGNCTLAVQSGAVAVLIERSSEREDDLAGTALAILGLLARFNEGLFALRETEDIVSVMLEVLKGRSMLSKEGAAEILLRLFDESEGCLRDALRLSEFSSVLADISVRGSAKAREKASLLMKKIMDADNGDNSVFLQW